MEIEIKAKPLKVIENCFNYGNIKSSYSVNSQYFKKNGKPVLPIAGELHFSRYPHSQWKKELLKMRALGITVVSTYVFWNYHEEEKGEFNWSGDNNVNEFLSICKEIDMPCILRIGPWCHGEVVRGGFPKRINKMAKKRGDYPKYLAEVKDFFTGLYKEVREFLDGETVLGIQLENEYTGSTEHIRTLRKIAEEVGFKTPFFTMTAWPANKPDNDFLPMCGGYPEAPWHYNKKPLEPHNRFGISGNRGEVLIGADMFKINKSAKDTFLNVPYACCEIGPGNQVTQHRRPVISAKDGYGVGFAKFASGANLLGYYMFHGGKNPNNRLMQESKLTAYPNNYPIIDYDFQSPLSRWGEVREHGEKLKLMHLFALSFDTEIAVKQPYFPPFTQKSLTDTEFLKCSVRMDENMSGYFFAGNYERGLKCTDFKDVNVNITLGEKKLILPSIDIKADSMIFYPFNLMVDGICFDYILAQPIAKIETDNEITCYFMQMDGIQPKVSQGGVIKELEVDSEAAMFKGATKNLKIVVMSYQKALTFNLVNNKVYFAKGAVYYDDSRIYCETTDGYLMGEDAEVKAEAHDLKDAVSLKKINAVSLPLNHYLYSYSRRKFYELEINKDILNENEDVRLEFDFTGLNLQVFSGKQIINDYFNTDGKFVMYLSQYKDYINKNNKLIIRTSKPTSHGVGHVYNEIGLTPGECELKLVKAQAVKTLKLDL